MIKERTLILLDVNENIKNITTVLSLYDKSMNFSAKKNLLVVSIGGGIIQDIAGFFANSLYRGINWIFIPTTLLAQTDSCIGAKVSLNFKNLIGIFYPPNKIYLNTIFLKTLTEVDYYSGIGEIAKLCIIDSFESSVYFKNNLKKFEKRENTFLNNIIKKSFL